MTWGGCDIDSWRSEAWPHGFGSQQVVPGEAKCALDDVAMWQCDATASSQPSPLWQQCVGDAQNSIPGTELSRPLSTEGQETLGINPNTATWDGARCPLQPTALKVDPSRSTQL